MNDWIIELMYPEKILAIHCMPNTHTRYNLFWVTQYLFHNVPPSFTTATIADLEEVLVRINELINLWRAPLSIDDDCDPFIYWGQTFTCNQRQLFWGLGLNSNSDLFIINEMTEMFVFGSTEIHQTICIIAYKSIDHRHSNKIDHIESQLLLWLLEMPTKR